jgi:hypothetical protein
MAEEAERAEKRMALISGKSMRIPRLTFRRYRLFRPYRSPIHIRSSPPTAAIRCSASRSAAR